MVNEYFCIVCSAQKYVVVGKPYIQRNNRILHSNKQQTPFRLLKGIIIYYILRFVEIEKKIQFIALFTY